jgi:hypothetical protein
MEHVLEYSDSLELFWNIPNRYDITEQWNMSWNIPEIIN